MAVTLTPRPRPGDLITADWMDRLASALEEHDKELADLRRRLAVLEKGGGKRGPEILQVDPNKYTKFIDDIRGGQIKVLDIADKSDRLEKAAEEYLKGRNDFVLDDEVKRSRELTEEEWIVVGTAAGIKPSEVPQILSDTRPVTAKAIDAKLGDQVRDLDSYANLTSGKLGFF